jgi:hypothetical protein
MRFSVPDLEVNGSYKYFKSYARAIREAINTCHKNMAELTKLVEQAQKFKNWIRGQPEDQDIRKAYCSEISKLGWCEGLPKKSARWFIFTVAGVLISSIAPWAVGAMAGVALSAVDSFLVDKLTQGWRPNQFVEGTLREFIGQGNHQ